jgi:hypothetical protein
MGFEVDNGRTVYSQCFLGFYCQYPTCQPSTVWCSRERLPAAAAQPAKVRQSCSATDYTVNIIPPLLDTLIIWSSVSQTMVHGPQMVRGGWPGGP